MDLTRGFKPSEAGPIPEDWEAEDLLARNALISGQHVMANYCNVSGDGTPYLTGPSDFVDGAIRLTKFTTQPLKVCAAGDTLVTVKGSGVGDLAYADRPYCISRQLMAIRPQGWDAGFVYLIAHEVAKRLVSSASGTIPGLSRADFAQVAVPTPPLLEQRAIASRLGDVDAWIAAAEAEAAKVAQVKAATMDALFTPTTRLPGFKGQWPLTALGEHLEFKNGISKAGQYFGYGSPIVNYMDVFANSHLVLSQLTGKVFVTSDEAQRFSVRHGDVFFTRTSETADEIGMASVAITDRKNVVFSGFVLRGRPTTSAFDSIYLGYVLRTDQVRRQIERLATYTTRALTNGGVLSLTRVACPPLPEQRAIAAVLADIDAALVAARTVVAKAKGVKAAAMDALLSGRIRLPVA